MDGTGKPTVVHCCSCSRCRSQPDGPTAKQHHALNDLVATLDEKSRRLVVGLLAKQQGRGGLSRDANKGVRRKQRAQTKVSGPNGTSPSSNGNAGIDIGAKTSLLENTGAESSPRQGGLRCPIVRAAARRTRSKPCAPSSPWATDCPSPTSCRPSASPTPSAPKAPAGARWSTPPR